MAEGPGKGTVLTTQGQAGRKEETSSGPMGEELASAWPRLRAGVRAAPCRKESTCELLKQTPGGAAVRGRDLVNAFLFFSHSFLEKSITGPIFEWKPRNEGGGSVIAQGHTQEAGGYRAPREKALEVGCPISWEPQKGCVLPPWSLAAQLLPGPRFS